MLSEQEQTMLRLAARRVDHPDFGKPNKKLEDIIKGITLLNPSAFLLTKKDLANRRFFHKPLGILTPFKSYVEEKV